MFLLFLMIFLNAYFSVFMVILLLLVAFLVLLERKILGMIQLRVGPNVVSVFGLVQTVMDGIKLLIKKSFLKNKSLFFIFPPLLGLFLSFVHWLVVPLPFSILGSDFSLIYTFVVLGIMVFVVLWAGWASESAYSLIGSIRSVAQMISYEVVFMFFLVCFFMLFLSFNWDDFLSKFVVCGCNMKIFFFLIWLVLMLSELNRTPFDLVESESELVSGFNVEYSGYGFTLLFLSEYMNIWFICYLGGLIFSWWAMSYYLVWFMLVLGVVIIRGLLPRFKFNQLINLMWSSFLPLVFVFLFVVLLIF